MSMAICEIHNVDFVDILQVEGSPAQSFPLGLECPICGTESEEALTDEDRDWLQWLACDFEDDDELAIEDDIRYAEHCIEDDYDWIRRGC